MGRPVEDPSGRAAARARAKREREELLGQARTRRPRVLVIEDSVDTAEILREVLEYGEHEVEVAFSGPEGLAKAREFRPDVVLCDIGLPGMDGYEVARAFRADEVLQGIHLAALSGYARPEDLRRAREAGFQRYLAKPPSLGMLEEAVATLSRLGPAAAEPVGESDGR